MVNYEYITNNMAAEKKKRKPVKKSARKKVINSAQYYNDDPYFIKKGEDAQATIQKYGLPLELIKKLEASNGK